MGHHAVSDTIWVTLALIVLIFETITILIPAKGDTLSEKLWELMCSALWRSMLYAVAFWLIWHLFLEPNIWVDRTASPIDDFVVVAVGAVVGFLVPPPKWRGGCEEG